MTRQLRQVLLNAKVGIGFAVFAAGVLVAAVVVPGSSNACFGLSGGRGFTITSVVTAYPACSGPSVALYPGVKRCLVYTAHNPLAVPLTVKSLNIASVTLTTQPRNRALPPCSTNELDLSATTFSGALVVPPLGTGNAAETITLTDTRTNQDNCEKATFDFVYAGSATYTETTSTSLASSPNPSKLGQTVSFVATVTPADLPPSKPTGTVNLYLCSLASCTSSTLLGSATLNGEGKATWSTSALPAGTDLIEAVYNSPSSDFGGSTSTPLSQVVQSAKYATTTTLGASPDPSAQGSPTSLVATVSKSSGPGTPTGWVSFYSGTPAGQHNLLGASSLDAGARATLKYSALGAGTDSLYAVYAGDTNFAPSTSPVVSETVVAPPSPCPGHFDNSFTGIPGSPVINGTGQDDFIYAFGGNYFVNGFGGNDCIWAGAGANLITDGDGKDVVLAGDGPDAVFVADGDDIVALGNGHADAVTAGSGNDTITTGSGDADAVTAGSGDDTVVVGNGRNDVVSLGNGANSVTLGTGTYNVVNLGNGPDTVTISSGGSHDTVNGGNGNETVYLGTGTYNAYNGALHRSNTCHIPAPPSSWKASSAVYYHDTLVNCTVVSP